MPPPPKEIAAHFKSLKAARPLRPGQRMRDGSIYVGTYKPMNSNVFAAPEDLLEMNYEQTVQAVRDLKQWHGHDGLTYKGAMKFYVALHTGTYNGAWVIPPVEILRGSCNNGYVAMSHKMSDIKNRFSSGWHWSATENGGEAVFTVRLKDGDLAPDTPKDSSALCRPVRLVEIPSCHPERSEGSS